mmetsp:Transcript_58747/g.127607  ORF Transcript_58747/g.127607 Transcript_58747/m.127607 type:complete len:288 (-) Transcript_58747:557-1420(-)
MRRGCIAAPLPVRRNAVARIVAVSAISIVGAGFSISITIVSTSVCGAAASLRLRVGAVVRASPRPVRRAVLLATPRPRRLRAVALPTRRVLSLLLRLGVGRRLRLSRDASARAAALAPAALRLDARTALVRPRRLALHVGVAPRAFAALAVDVGQFGLDAGGMGAAAATTPRERKQQLGQLRQQLRVWPEHIVQLGVESGVGVAVGRRARRRLRGELRLGTVSTHVAHLLVADAREQRRELAELLAPQVAPRALHERLHRPARAALDRLEERHLGVMRRRAAAVTAL